MKKYSLDFSGQSYVRIGNISVCVADDNEYRVEINFNESNENDYAIHKIKTVFYNNYCKLTNIYVFVDDPLASDDARAHFKNQALQDEQDKELQKSKIEHQYSETKNQIILRTKDKRLLSAILEPVEDYLNEDFRPLYNSLNISGRTTAHDEQNTGEPMLELLRCRVEQLEALSEELGKGVEGLPQIKATLAAEGELSPRTSESLLQFYDNSTTQYRIMQAELKGKDPYKGVKIESI